MDGQTRLRIGAYVFFFGALSWFAFRLTLLTIALLPAK